MTCASATPVTAHSSRNLMGIRMDDLHAPTVSSGPTSGGYSNGVSKDQLSLQELMAEKDRAEAELKALGQVLDSVCISPVMKKELVLMLP
jgi:hypothetical protein